MTGSVVRFAESLMVSALETALDRVRSFKEEVHMNQVKSTWKCPICGDTGFKSRAGAKTHMTRLHKAPYDAEPVEEEVPVELATVRAEREKSAKVMVVSSEAAPEKSQEASTASVNPEVMKTVSLFDNAVGDSVQTEVKAQVVVTPPVVARVDEPPPPAMMPVLTNQIPESIPVDAVLDLNVPTWKKQLTTWEVGYPVHQQVKVISKEIGADGSSILMCEGDGIWSVPESAVLSRVIALVSLPDYSAALEAERLRKEKMDEFRIKRDTYVAAREAAKGPQSVFEKVRSDYREFLMSVIKEFGCVSKTNPNTVLLETDDYMCMVSATRPEPVLKYNKERITSFLVEGGFDDYLTLSFDEEKWAELKLKEYRDSGEFVVPREFIQEVETLQEFDSTEALRIDPLVK